MPPPLQTAQAHKPVVRAVFGVAGGFVVFLPAVTPIVWAWAADGTGTQHCRLQAVTVR